MMIRDFIPGEEEVLRGVFASSVHDLAASFYTPEQINAWAPAAYDRQKWVNKLSRLQPFVAVLEGQVAGYASLRESGYIGPDGHNIEAIYHRSEPNHGFKCQTADV